MNFSKKKNFNFFGADPANKFKKYNKCYIPSARYKNSTFLLHHCHEILCVCVCFVKSLHRIVHTN